MKIWRDDITKENLKNGSTLCASASFLFMMGGVLALHNPKMVAIACVILTVVCFVFSLILHIKAKSMKE